MKKILLTSLLILGVVMAYAQQAADIDPRFVQLPRYANLAAINASIPFPIQGMQVYDLSTGSVYHFNGTVWTNNSGAVTGPLNLSSAGSTFYSTASGTTGKAGVFTNTNTSNPDYVINAQHLGTGTAGNFINLNTTNTTHTLNAENFGLGTAGRFSINSINNPSNALYVLTSGLGRAATFQINNALNTLPSIYAVTNGSGEAIVGENTSNTKPTAIFTNANVGGYALETFGGLRFGGTNVGSAAAGKFLMSNDIHGNATWQILPKPTEDLDLTSSGNTTLKSTNSSTTNHAGEFIINNTNNTKDAINVKTNGNGSAGYFLISKATNSNSALASTTLGTGYAIEALNSSASKATIYASNNTPLAPAIEISGAIKVSGGSNKTAFKVITDATYISVNKFGILNTTMANHVTDILLVTYQYTGGTYLNKQFATYWNGGNWEIHLTDGTAMPVGITFNILVIKQ
jgi:hypothetical protein